MSRILSIMASLFIISSCASEEARNPCDLNHDGCLDENDVTEDGVPVFDDPNLLSLFREELGVSPGQCIPVETSIWLDNQFIVRNENIDSFNALTCFNRVDTYAFEHMSSIPDDLSPFQDIPVRRLSFLGTDNVNLEGLANNSFLTQLILAYSNVQNLEPLGVIPTLGQLNIRQNRGIDISDISNFEKLYYLNASCCDLTSEDVDILLDHPNISNMHIILDGNNISFTDEQRLIEATGDNIEYWSMNCEVNPEGEIFTCDTDQNGYIEGEELSIFNPIVLDVIREDLELSESDPLTVEDINSITLLEFMETGIINLAGLECVVNLERVLIHGIREHFVPLDLTVLSRLPYLNSLIISRRNMLSLEQLSELNSLEMLSLVECDLDDINVLQNLDHLEFLDLSANYFLDIAPVIEMTSLGYVNLSWCLLEQQELDDLMQASWLEDGVMLDLTGNDYTQEIIQELTQRGVTVYCENHDWGCAYRRRN